MREPIWEKNIMWGFFHVFFILIGTFFVLNLCVGVIIDNFNQMKRETDGEGLLLTESQKKWVDSQTSAAIGF